MIFKELFIMAFVFAFPLPRFTAFLIHTNVARRRFATAKITSLNSEASLSDSVSNNDMTAPPVIPRAAVSVVARHVDNINRAKYVLVQRGKEPNKGMWSLPGGKIEPGEKSLAAAKRELLEETGLGSLCTDDSCDSRLEWSEDGPVCVTDSIHVDDKNVVRYHYTISQWFVNIIKEQPTASNIELPKLVASDDAEDAKWFELKDIQKGVELGHVTIGVEKVVLRSELMYEKGVL